MTSVRLSPAYCRSGRLLEVAAEALLARVPQKPAPAAPSEPAKPWNPHVIILEGSGANPRAELEDDPLQVALGNFFKVSCDEYAERLLRQETLEQKLSSLKLSVDGSRMSEAECVGPYPPPYVR